MTGTCDIAGTVISVIYQNEESGYAVLRFQTIDGEIVTVVGSIPYAAPGEDWEIEGRWVSHPIHGEQIQALRVERYMPTETEGILAFLSSGAIHGIGPVTATRIVQRFGEESLRIIEEEPEKLAQVPGLSGKKAQEIAENYRYHMGMRRLMDFLAAHELPVTLAIRLYRQYGVGALAQLRENPYLLVEEAYGVDFSLADSIALSLGMAGDSCQRVEAAVLFELSYNAGYGHVFLPRDKLLAAAARLIQCPEDTVEASLERLLERGMVHQDTVARLTVCYLRRLYDAELSVTRRLEKMLCFRADQGTQVEKGLEQIQKEQGIVYAPAQRQAVELAAQEGVMLLTGGPGTGKTTSVRGIVAMLERLGLRVLLLAPTGRAANRLGELCGREAQTIHRALGMTRREDTGEIAFQKNEKDLLEAEAVIVDEMSMVDLPLMAALLAAMKTGCRLVMVGDPQQLPSVGPGHVFSDVIRSGRVPIVALTEIFRQAQASAIVRAAHQVNQGILPPLRNTMDSDFFFMRRQNPAMAVELVVDLCRRRLPESMGIDAKQIQVLCPTRKGDWGTEALNKALQAALNPPSPVKRQKAWGDIVFRMGDRVMQTRNNYDVVWQRPDGTSGSGLFNGDVGVVEEIDAAGEWMAIRFDGRLATYTIDMLGELELAYAITVHKSQGSEYQAVVLVALPAAASLMIRSVLYTGLTRAKELLIVVGDEETLAYMTENNKQARRYSGLRWRLGQGGNKPEA